MPRRQVVAGQRVSSDTPLRRSPARRPCRETRPIPTDLPSVGAESIVMMARTEERFAVGFAATSGARASDAPSPPPRLRTATSSPAPARRRSSSSGPKSRISKRSRDRPSSRPGGSILDRCRMSWHTPRLSGELVVAELGDVPSATVATMSMGRLSRASGPNPKCDGPFFSRPVRYAARDRLGNHVGHER